MYGKLIEGKLIEAPAILEIDKNIVFNPSDVLLRENGYKLVVYNAPIEEEDGYYAEEYWVEEGDKIVQKWKLSILSPVDSARNIYVWDVWQGRHLNKGDYCIIDGRTFVVKVAHDAAWNKRPITGVNWEDYFEEVGG